MLKWVRIIPRINSFHISQPLDEPGHHGFSWLTSRSDPLLCHHNIRGDASLCGMIILIIMIIVMIIVFFNDNDQIMIMASFSLMIMIMVSFCCVITIVGEASLSCPGRLHQRRRGVGHRQMSYFHSDHFLRMVMVVVIIICPIFSRIIVGFWWWWRWWWWWWRWC